MLFVSCVLCSQEGIHCEELSPARLPGLTSNRCSVNYTESLASSISDIITEKFGGPPLHTCGKGTSQRAAYLNISDPTTECPSNWRLYEGEVRACGSNTTNGGCSSARFSTNTPYNHVFGRIIGYQKGSPDAFDTVLGSAFTIEEAYVDGVSLTYGATGSRKHIWTFVMALHYEDPLYGTRIGCECTNINYNWTEPFPSFIGNNYFCESGNAGPGYDHTQLYPEDPVWDGQGCPSTSTCCTNGPPWFCASLNETTTEDLEIRICQDQPQTDEDVLVSLIDIYTANF